MEWEDDEDDEIQVSKDTGRIPEEKRHYQRRASNVQQHRRKELSGYEDPFPKRLGRRATSFVSERTSERNHHGFSTATAKTTSEPPKWASIDEIPKSSARNNEVVKVDVSWCKWPCSSEGLASVPQNDSRRASQSVSKQPPTKSHNEKEKRNLGSLLTRKLFRQSNENETVAYPAWENEWALFREQHELEMRQMKQMYMSLQEICLELKKMGTYKDDGSAGSSSRRQSTESTDSRADLLGRSKRYAATNYAPYTRENGHHQPNRRAKSAPKTRVNGDHTKENGMAHVRGPFGTSWCCPTAALFEEIVQVERVYIRNFVAALIKYEEDRFPIKEDFDFKQIKGGSLRDVIDRLLPHANFAKPWHYKYGIEAWLSRIVFKEFGKGAVSKLEVSERGQDARAKRNDSWEEYQKLSLLSPIDAIDPEGEAYCGSFHLFCNRKFDNIQNELRWQEEWPDNLVKDFLEAMKHVWRAHKLALSFDPVASLFSVKSTAQFDVKFMEPLGTATIFQTDTPQVGFLVNPGFIVLERIIKCQVYLSPDENLDDSS